MIRAYIPSDKPALIKLIRLNTPTYFDKEEETELAHYLDNQLEDYFVIEQYNKIIGCGGINYELENKTAIISWDIIHPQQQGKGIGKNLLTFRINKIKKTKLYTQIIVRTSQHTFKFYNKLGFVLLQTSKNYWAKGIDLYYMALKIS